MPHLAGLACCSNISLTDAERQTVSEIPSAFPRITAFIVSSAVISQVSPQATSVESIAEPSFISNMMAAQDCCTYVSTDIDGIGQEASLLDAAFSSHRPACNKVTRVSTAIHCNVAIMSALMRHCGSSCSSQAELQPVSLKLTLWTSSLSDESSSHR